MKLFVTKVIVFFISILDNLISKNQNYVVYNSYPDLSDNSFALFLFILKKYPEKKNIWLVNKLIFKNCESLINEYSNNKNYKLIKRDSIQGIYYYLRAKYVFFTHGLYAGSKISKEHCVVNLWHGMPLKKIGLLEKNSILQNSKYTIASSSFFQKIMARALDLDIKNVLIVGQPRNDLMFEKINYISKMGIVLNDTTKIILWTPTYRQSIIGDIRKDGKVSKDLPVIKSSKFDELNKFIQSINSFLIIKLHPMDILNREGFKNYSNIQIVKNNDLEKLHIQLYSLLGSVDILLTDFSSIYIDYLLLNRPIGFITDDFQEYSNSRGFVFDNPENYMPGEKICSLKELKAFLHNTIILKHDPYLKNRTVVNNNLNNEYPNYSNELLKAIKFI